MSRELPPRSKKLSCTPTSSRPSTSAQMAAMVLSMRPAGASKGDPAWVRVWSDAEGDASNANWDTGDLNPEGNSTTNTDFVVGVSYTVKARAIDAGGNTSAEALSSFTYFEGNAEAMVLTLEADPKSILKEGLVSATINLSSASQVQPNLNDIPVELQILPPDVDPD